MSTYGAIDVGSNSVRMLIAGISGGDIVTLYAGMRTTRLGAGLAASGLLAEDTQDRTLASLREFLEIAAAYPDLELGAVATSAVREAANGARFVERIWLETGIQVQVLSGREEARLSYQGATRSPAIGQDAAVIDVGGGSTELMYQHDRRLHISSSPVGAVRCTETMASPAEILAELEPALQSLRATGVGRLVGVGGTATSLAAMHQRLAVYDPRLVHGYYVDREAIGHWLLQLARLSLAERRKVPGLHPDRADIIVAGIKILWVVVTYLDLPGLTVSEHDLLHGIIMDLAGSAV